MSDTKIEHSKKHPAFTAYHVRDGKQGDKGFWTRIGVKTQVEVVPWSVYAGRANKNEYAVSMLAWGNGTGEASYALVNVLAPRLFDPDAIRHALVTLTPLQRRILDEVHLPGGDAPTGLIHDAWNIRLVPHYWLGVFFVLSHVASGLRVVLSNHGLKEALVVRGWTAGVIASAVIASLIVAGLCGLRLG